MPETDTLVGSPVAEKAAKSMGAAVDAAVANIFMNLTLHDKCDRCIQNAVAQILAGDNLLLMCGHHFRDNYDAVIEKGYLFQFNGEQPNKYKVSV